MNLKLGDKVIQRNDDIPLTYVIDEFIDNKDVVIRGVEIPIITIVKKDNLIKISTKRNMKSKKLRIIK